jgi:hypothetical protein
MSRAETVRLARCDHGVPLCVGCYMCDQEAEAGQEADEENRRGPSEDVTWGAER